MAEDRSIVSETRDAVQVATDFRTAFWGEGGVELLYQNAKQANNTSKELEGYLRDRAKTEESVGKELQKLAKHNGQVSQHVGVFTPAWVELVHSSSEKFASAHLSVANQFNELAKEVGAYHSAQKDQYRLTKESAIIPCTEAQSALEQATIHALKCKSSFHHANDQHVDLCEQHSKAQREVHKPKDVEKLEARIKKAEAQRNQSESDYRASLQKQATAHEDFKVKMVVMCDRLQKVEKDHLSQMKKFVAKSFDLDCQMQETVDSVKKHQAKERALTADIILQQFVAVKATGSVFVEPLKFESPSVVPTPLSTSASATDMASVASTEVAAAQAKKKWLRKKKKEGKEKGKGGGEDKEDTSSQHQVEQDANVDDEGYSIRPTDADRVGATKDRDSDFSYGSDSDSEKETESKLKSISIRPVNELRTRSVSNNSTELSAAVQSLMLKPPTKVSSTGESSNRQTAANRSIMDDDGPRNRSNSLMDFSMLSPNPAPSQALPVASAVSSAGSSTPPTNTREPSGILLPQVGGITPPVSTSPARFTPDPSRSRSPALARNTSSPARAASSSSIPVYALFTETVNALFKGTDLSSTLVKVTGELQLSFPAASVSHITPTTAPLVIQLQPQSIVEQYHANTHLLEADPAASPGDHVVYRFKMAALQAFLKTQRDLTPSSAFYKVEIFKYQTRVNSATALPVHVNCLWKCEETVSNLKVGYTYNPHCRFNPAPIKFVSFITPADNVSNVQSNPPAQIVNERLTWKVPEIAPSPAPGSLLAKIDLKTGPGKPSPVAVQFSLDGHSLSGFDMEITSSAYQLVLLKHRLNTGKYMAEPK